MNQEKAIEIVNKLLFGIQRARTASREGVEALAKKQGASPVIVNNVLEDLNPWLHGERGDALLNGLTLVSDRGRVTGGELFNFMFIIHTLNPHVGAMASIFADTEFPQPNPQWFTDLGM